MHQAKGILKLFSSCTMHQENYDAPGIYLISLKHEMPEHLSKQCPENCVSVPEPLFRMNASSIFLFGSIQM